MGKGRIIQPMIPPDNRRAVQQQRALSYWLAFLQAAENHHHNGAVLVAAKGYLHILQTVGPHNEIGRRAGMLLSLCQYQLRQYDEAVLVMEAVRDLRFDDPNVHYNLGLIYQAARRPQDAVDAYRAALALAPDMVMARNNLGNALRELGDQAGAQFCYDRILGTDPTDAHARYNLAHVVLLHGDLRRGFELYESRWDIPAWNAEYGRPDITTPRLTREDAPCRVLVRSEQGIGDHLQMLRFVPLLIERGHAVTVEIKKDLASWLCGAGLPFPIVPEGEVPEHDRHIPMQSLPAFLGVAAESDIPAPFALPVRVSSPLWTKPGDTREIIGVCWAGNPLHHADHHRSAQVEQLVPIFERPNTRFVVIQVGPRGVELQSLLPTIKLGENSEIVDVTAGLRTFEHTAAVMRQCSAVVTVDTSVAHLAGTLGVRCFVLTSWLSEWRWQLQRDDSPWYPSLRLVRQPALGDWAGAATEVARLLEAA